MAVAGLMSTTAFGQNTVELGEVVVSASRISNNAEGYVANLKGSKLTKGKVAAQALCMLPHITMEEGSLKINGLAVSEIYVDGNKLVSSAELQNIPADKMDQVQVTYVAGSNQNAALSGGVIKISLRKPPVGGYYGSIIGDASWSKASGFGNESIGGMINYRHKNLSVYDNVSYGANKTKEVAEQTIVNSSQHSMYDETERDRGTSFRNRLSLSQDFSSGSSLGLSYYLATNSAHPSTSTQSDVSSLISGRSRITAQEGTIRFTTPLNKKGASLKLLADYFNRHSTADRLYAEDAVDMLSTNEKENLGMWKFSADVVNPIKRSLIWKYGASLQTSSYEYTPSSINMAGRYSISNAATKTTGLTPIVYASASGVLGRIRYSAGLNWQLNRIGYQEEENSVDNHNTQWAFNPTVQMMMPLGKQRQHALMLSYKRTLNDIPYTAISSTQEWTDAYNYTVGNPDLKATSADLVILGAQLFKNKLGFTAIYSRVHDRIFWASFKDSDRENIFYTKPINLSGQNLFGFGLEWNESPAQWWSFKLTGRVEITPEDLTIDGVYYGSTHCKEYFAFNNDFSFKNGWGGYLNATFEPTYRSYSRVYHSVYDVSGRIYKSLLRDRLMIGLDFVAFGKRRQLDRHLTNSLISRNITSPVQSIGISVVWNFSGGKKVNVDVVDGIQSYHKTKEDR